MTERTKIGPRVDEALWAEFREDVRERKGQTRGVLGDELENAIREYLRDDATPTEKRIEKRLARVEEAVGAAPADGGPDTSDDEPHTHAPSRVSAAASEKPAANAATEKKIAYLAERLKDKQGGEIRQVTRETIIEVVKEEYGFRSDTAKRYVEQLVGHFGLVAHPKNDAILMTEAQREQIAEALREERREKAKEEIES